MTEELDDDLLVEVIRDHLLGGRYVEVRIRSLTKMYGKRLERQRLPYEVMCSRASMSHQIKNYLINNKFRKTDGSPAGWILTRKAVEKLCRRYKIEIFPLGTV